MTTVLSVPQWQGSASDGARRLTTGARRVAELMPTDRVVTVPVVDELTDKVDGIRSLQALVDNQRLARESLAPIDDFVITVGGECSVDLASIAAAHDKHGDALTVLWIDAHPDVYSPETLPSGAFHGMVVRALLGDAPVGLRPDRPLDPSQVMILGERAGSDAEHEYIARTGLRRHGVHDLERVFAQVTGPVYVHVDLDVLEPTVFDSVCYPEPDGLHPEHLVDLISSLDDVVGAAITEAAPSTDHFTPTHAVAVRALGMALAPH